MPDVRETYNHEPAVDRLGRQFRRVIYVSLAVSDDIRRDHLEILRQSRANNGMDGVSGFLWTDDTGYVQVLEGAPEAISQVLERIIADPRHRDVQIVSDELSNERAFGDWTMASLPAERDERLLRERIARLLRRSPQDVRTAFNDVGLREDPADE